jgi:hypothetical protein
LSRFQGLFSRKPCSKQDHATQGFLGQTPKKKLNKLGTERSLSLFKLAIVYQTMILNHQIAMLSLS